MKKEDMREGLKVLFIDNSRLLRKSMEFYFKNKAALFVSAESAEQGIRHVEHHCFDIVICDFNLDGMNGLMFFEILKKRGSRAKTIIISAYVDHKMCVKASRIGVSALIKKPLDGFTVERVISEVTMVD
ncbi:MAG: response regulator [Deltaproteobacteria bacterium]|nr:response regulator [Deltaproteobacteria bacterium]